MTFLVYDMWGIVIDRIYAPNSETANDRAREKHESYGWLEEV